MPVHNFPRLFSTWGNGADARWDLQAISAEQLSSGQAAKAANPDLVLFMTYNLTGTYPINNVTYGAGFDGLSSPVTDTVTDGSAGNAGYIRAFNSYWDNLYTTTGSLVPPWPPAGGRLYNLAMRQADSGIEDTWQAMARFLLYNLKRNRLYRDSIWSGYRSDNWMCIKMGGYGNVSNVDSDRNSVTDTAATLYTNWNDGLNGIGRYLSENLPGMGVGGNVVWWFDPRNGNWAQYQSDPNGWHKYCNLAELEVGENFLYSNAMAQRAIDICNSTSTATDPTTGSSMLGWNNYPDYYGRERYFAFYFQLRNDANTAYLALPSDYNNPAVYKQETYYKPARKGMALACCMGAYYWPRFEQQTNSRLFYDDEMRGGTLNARGWMGQPIAAATNPVTNVFMREFQHGLAICNVGGTAQTASLPGGANVWRRIQGDGTNTFNTGATVSTATLSIPAHDGIFLVRIGTVPPPSGDAPANTTAPSISGTAQVGETLTPDVGSWANAPASFRIRWYRYLADGTTLGSTLLDETIPFGVTPSTYTVDLTDVGYTTRLEVTATNAYGSSVALSQPTPVITVSGGTGSGPIERFDGPPSAIRDFTLAAGASVSLPLTLTFKSGRTVGSVSLPLTASFTTRAATSTQVEVARVPSLTFDVAFPSQPLSATPEWSDLSSRQRSLSTQRGRSYEFDRMETGTLDVVLSNRDAALSPTNSSSPYGGLKSTRPVRLQAVWAGGVYPVFRGISEGYPLTYPSLGKDALVQFKASDPFYALNRARFPAATSFAEELSGLRIQHVLEAIGFDSGWYDLDAGQTLIAESGDLSETNPLEHISLVTECEFGRFFASRAGKFTFRDRSSVILDYLTPVMTFADGSYGDPDALGYVIEGALEHSEEKLYNRVKITTPSGYVADVSNLTSIADHFERVFEREWPYANDNDADSAAHFILMRSVEHSLRLPALTVSPARSPSVYWPKVLAREIGDRCLFKYQPEGGGDAIEQDVVIEGISHSVAPLDHRMQFQLTEADPNEYWILGLATYGELGTATVVAF